MIPYPVVEQVVRWKAQLTRHLLRYPCLGLLGPSFSGKTEYGASLYGRPLVLFVGRVLFVPDGIRAFHCEFGEGSEAHVRRTSHDAVVFDDIRDAEFLRQHQDLLQGTNYVHEFGQSPTGGWAFRRNLHQIPFIVTLNWSTANLDLLLDDDWCKLSENLHLVRWPPAHVAAACGLRPFAFPPPGTGKGEMPADFAARLEARFDS